MIEKKLLTLVGVAGILACGACFLPDLPQRKIPLPPALASVHTIAINVEDGTGSNLFDPHIMSFATANNFNSRWVEYPITAKAVSPGEASGAVLKIAVQKKTVSCESRSNGKQFCTCEMIASFTLTAADGRVLHSKAQGSSKFRIWRQGGSWPDNLNEEPFRYLASDALALTAGNLLFHSASSQ